MTKTVRLTRDVGKVPFGTLLTIVDEDAIFVNPDNFKVIHGAKCRYNHLTYSFKKKITK